MNWSKLKRNQKLVCLSSCNEFCVRFHIPASCDVSWNAAFPLWNLIWFLWFQFLFFSRNSSPTTATIRTTPKTWGNLLIIYSSFVPFLCQCGRIVDLGLSLLNNTIMSRCCLPLNRYWQLPRINLNGLPWPRLSLHELIFVAVKSTCNGPHLPCKHIYS